MTPLITLHGHHHHHLLEERKVQCWITTLTMKKMSRKILQQRKIFILLKTPKGRQEVFLEIFEIWRHLSTRFAQRTKLERFFEKSCICFQSTLLIYYVVDWKVASNHIYYVMTSNPTCVFFFYFHLPSFLWSFFTKHLSKNNRFWYF